MTINEAIKSIFSRENIGTVFTSKEIVDAVSSKYGINPSSILPSDYCYNRNNNGLDFEKSVHLFEYLNNGQYKYLGENYNYRGTILQKERGSDEEKVIGRWENGKYTIDINFSIVESVWLATAILAYNEYYKTGNQTKNEMFFKQTDIQKKAEELCGHRVENARISQWCNADHSNHTYNYLREGSDATRRLTFHGEFNGEKEMPNLNEGIVVQTDFGPKTIKEVEEFISSEYTALFSNIKKSSHNDDEYQQLLQETDCISILDYIDQYAGEAYEDPQKANPLEKEKLLQIKMHSIAAVKELDKMARLCEIKFGLKKGNASRWLNGKNNKIRGYLWQQLKLPGCEKYPTSISLFAEKDDGKAHFRFSLELYDAQSKQEDYERHHKLLNIDIADASDKLVYMAGGIDYDAPLAQLNLSTAEVKKGVENGTYKKIQLSRIIERSDIEHNFGMLNSLLEAVEALMPYYNLVVKDGDVVPMTDAKISKNMILYGPPGTGKTYNAVYYAVAIVENRDEKELAKNEDYSSVLQRYHTYKKEGKIAFTTFHQSYGYEEFIEGIKPELSSDDEESGDLAYKIEPGIFKKFCETAGTKTLKIDNVYIKEMPQVWCVMLQDRSGSEHNKLKQRCFSNNYIKIGWPEQDRVSDVEIEKFNPLENAIIKNFCDQMEKGDIVVIQSGQQTIDALGVVKGDYWYDKEDPEFPRTREVSWLKTNIDENIYTMNGNVALDRKSTYQLKRILPNDALALVAKYSDTDEASLSENESNYVFIIDEINRGNISKIFGELITLIESTKRLGEAEAATAILPYSGEDFGVPSNVYILGTMNTADRSIALMDTALRRRFHFVEMMPDSSVLSKLQITDVDGIDIIKMLDIINERIEYLFDREHTIGHAYFTGLKNDLTLEKLADIFQNKIIPLLQEYFYEDYSKIQLILGDNEKEDSLKFILDEALKVKEVFKGNPDIDLPERKYSIQKSAFSKKESYVQIYE